MADVTRKARQLQMICTETGYAIINDFDEVLLELSVEAGQSLFHEAYRSLPEVESIFLRGVVAGHRAAGPACRCP